MIKHKKNNLIFFTYKIFENAKHIKHLVSTRIGGYSTGSFSSLNLGLHVKDFQENVLANREAICKLIDVEPDALVAGEQIHGTNVVSVSLYDKGKGALDWNEGIKCTDALITNACNLPLFMVAADCVMLSFFDCVENVIAIAHAGWRGTTNIIAKKTVQKMINDYDCKPANILAALSPSIGPCCYKIKSETSMILNRDFPVFSDNFIISRNDELYLDLWKANLSQLLEVGLNLSNIEISGICTSCNKELFYSYRADGEITGRFCTIIILQ